MLVERAESVLTAKEKEPAEIDAAAAMLEQALLHARGGSEPHKAARQTLQRMVGDVGYWRASARLQKAATELTDAAKQFEAAAGQLPRYVSDAGAWAAHVRKLAEELRAGPSGARTPSGTAAVTPPPDRPDRPMAPAGVALPV
jgi:succinate dehydrogenase/fumarate reductase flavoprotein subunit